MARLGDVLAIAGAVTGSPGLSGLGKHFTDKRDKKKKRKLNREFLSIHKERNQILKDRNRNRAYS